MLDKSLFARNLRSGRMLRGMTREQLAEKAGTGPEMVGRYERGESTPPIRTMVALADALGTTTSHLSGRGGVERELLFISE